MRSAIAIHTFASNQKRSCAIPPDPRPAGLVTESTGFKGMDCSVSKCVVQTKFETWNDTCGEPSTCDG